MSSIVLACARLLVIVLAVATAQARQAPLHRHDAVRVSMGSAFEIRAYGRDPAALPAIAESAFDEVDRIDRLMSHYKPDSTLSRINRGAAAAPVAVDRELFDFIAAALRYTRESDGAFDITVGPLMKAWGFFDGGGRVPSEAALAAARKVVGAGRVTLDRQRRTIAFDREGVEFDLGGIAKGYAVDRAVQILRGRGVSAALISAGGSTIYGLGAPPDADSWSVTIEGASDAPPLTVTLRDRALSVSGSSEKFFESGGRRYSHIMDPRTGRPAEGVLSVAVLAATGTAADALDNVFFVLGPAQTRARLKQWGKVEAFLLLVEQRDGWLRVAGL